MASRPLPPASIIPFPTPCSPVRLVIGIRVGARPKCTLRTTGGRLIMMMDGAWHGITLLPGRIGRIGRHSTHSGITLLPASMPWMFLRSRAGAKLGHGPPACWSLLHGHTWLETPGDGGQGRVRPISEVKQLWRGYGEAHVIVFSAQPSNQVINVKSLARRLYCGTTDFFLMITTSTPWGLTLCATHVTDPRRPSRARVQRAWSLRWYQPSPWRLCKGDVG
jgi:hypothetical protein